MTLTINKDQHYLCKVQETGVVATNKMGNFMIYDSLAKKTMFVGGKSVDEMLNFFGDRIALVSMADDNDGADIAEPSTSTGSNVSSPSSAAETSLCSTAQQEIWVKNSGKQSALDRQATDDLIALVKEEQKRLKDSHTTKKYVWADIGHKMAEKYKFGDRDSGKVCQQKWKNMESNTIRIIHNAGPKNTGGGGSKVPDYFEAVRDVIKDSAKAVPANFKDSISIDATEKPVVLHNVESSTSKRDSDVLSDDENEQAQSAAEGCVFMKVNASSKPKRQKASNTEILEFLKAESEKKDKQNEELLKIFAEKAKDDKEAKQNLCNLMAKFLEK